ncbi:MAG TPA: response regulator, partial [Bdellovibrionota bacterium]|nr:response regulator [Bdellovibrionota bacterium]
MNKKYKILTVDDEPVNLKLLEAHLVPRGYEVLQAKNGLEALEVLSREPIDIVLLDVMMPQINGFEVLKKIRADEKLRLTPVILVTALKATEDRINGIQAGCDDFISKPFDKGELLARIQSLLKISYYRQQLDLKEKFEKVVNNINEGVVICSPDWKIKEINDAGKTLLSLDSQDQTEKDILDIIFDKCSVSLSRDFISNTKNPIHQFELMRPETKQTTPLYLEANLDLLHTPEGQLSNIVLRLHDKTEEKNQYLLKQDFMSFMTHKLFNPLTHLMGQVELISSDHYGKLSGDQKKAFEQIYELSKKIKNRVTKLLNFVN